MTSSSRLKEIGQLPFDEDEAYTIYETKKGVVIEQDFGTEIDLSKLQIEFLIPLLVNYLNSQPKEPEELEMLLNSMDWRDCVVALENNQKKIVKRIEELESQAHAP